MRKLLVFGVVVTSLFAWNVSASWAGAPGFSIDPTSGPPGTTIHAQSIDFSCGDGGGGDVHVGLFAPGNTDTPIAEAETTSLDETPQWTVDLVVPANSAPGDYLVRAVCSIPQQETSFEYIPQTFTVTAPPATTTTSTTTTTVAAAASTTTTTVPVPVAPAAPPAQPVVASPALTG